MSSSQHRSQRKQIIVNSLYNLSGFGGILLINLLVVPYYIHQLTAEGYGLYIVVGSLISYAGTLDFGLARGLTKYVAECETKQDWVRMGQYMGASILMVLMIGSLAGLAILMGRDGLVSLLIRNKEVVSMTREVLALVALGMPFALLLMVGSAAVKGLQLYAAMNKVNVGMGIIGSLFKVLLLALGYGVVALIVTDVGIAILAGVGLLVYVKRKVPKAPMRIGFHGEVIRELYSFGGYFLVFRISTMSSTLLPRFVLSSLLGTSAVTYYEVGSKALSAVRGILNRATEVIMPAASQLAAATDSRTKFTRSYVEAAKYFALVSVPMFLLLAIFSFDVLEIWVGESLAQQGALVLTVLSIAYLINNFNNIPVHFALGQGQTRLVAAAGAATLIITAVLIVPLTKMSGVVGTAVSVLLGTQIGSVIFIVLYNKSLDVPLASYVKSVVAYPVFVAGIIAMLAFLVRTAIQVNPFVSLGLAALSGAVYFLVIWRSSAISPTMKQQLLTMIPGRK